MSRKFKLIWAAALAVLAVSALGASAAQANFTAGAYPATGTGVISGENHTLALLSGRVVTCEEMSFSGTLTEASADLTIDPQYDDCHANVLGSKLDVTVDFSSCNYTFTSTPSALIHLQCGEGDDVTITVYNGSPVTHSEANEVCKYTIKPQTIGGVTYDNVNGTPDDVVVTNTSNVATERVKGGALLCGPASGTSVYKGNTTFTGESAGEPVDVSVDQ